jgi:hypothetical protein
MQAAEQWAREQGCWAIYLRSHVSRADAHQFYHKIGYDIVTSAQLQRKNYQQAQEVLSQALADARTTLRDARHAITDLRCRTPRVDQLISSVQQEIQMQPKTLESGRKYKSWA